MFTPADKSNQNLSVCLFIQIPVSFFILSMLTKRILGVKTCRNCCLVCWSQSCPGSLLSHFHLLTCDLSSGHVITTEISPLQRFVDWLLVFKCYVSVSCWGFHRAFLRFINLGLILKHYYHSSNRGSKSRPVFVNISVLRTLWISLSSCPNWSFTCGISDHQLQYRLAFLPVGPWFVCIVLMHEEVSAWLQACVWHDKTHPCLCLNTEFKHNLWFVYSKTCLIFSSWI